MPSEPIYLNAGIYTVTEAARLSGVPARRIRRWLSGYNWTSSNKKRRASAAVWEGQFKPIDGQPALGFLDLIEVKFVDAFLKAGVTWRTIRKAMEYARKKLPGTTHPFCTRRFVTDGREILLRAIHYTNDTPLIEIANDQAVFGQLLEPFIIQMDFGKDDVLERWWPLGKDYGVAVDPRRNFGQPSVFQAGVPTRVLARSVKANESVEQVARWYELTVDSVKKAVEFENQLAA